MIVSLTFLNTCVYQGLPVVTITRNTYSTTTGTSVTLECTASGIPAPTAITWEYTKNSVKTNINVNPANYLGGSVSNPSLTIVTPANSDEGNYVCTATNSIGTGRSSSTYLFVTGSKCHHFESELSTKVPPPQNNA